MSRMELSNWPGRRFSRNLWNNAIPSGHLCKSFIFGLFLAVSWIVRADAASLIYGEAQAVAGYSSSEDKVVYASKDARDVMQKPSLGFDLLHRFTGETGDRGAFALQARIAYDTQDDEKDAEFQLYNAYFKYKAGFSDLWIGHNRPALGLSSYFDSHGLLLDTIAMNGFGYDRDWGAGAYRDFEWGNAAFSITTGSGMPVYFKGNYLASFRISRGVLAQDNYNTGISLAYGKPLETMGYHLMMDEPKETTLVGADGTWLWDNFETRVEVMGGRNREEDAKALFLRFGIHLLEEGRLTLEIQPMYVKIGNVENTILSAGPAYQLTADLTLRAMYQYDEERNDHRMVFQLYWYSRL